MTLEIGQLSAAARGFSTNYFLSILIPKVCKVDFLFCMKLYFNKGLFFLISFKDFLRKFSVYGILPTCVSVHQCIQELTMVRRGH